MHYRSNDIHSLGRFTDVLRVASPLCLGALVLLLCHHAESQESQTARIVTIPRTLADGATYFDVAVQAADHTTVVNWTTDDYKAVMSSDDRYDSSGRLRMTGPFLATLDGFRTVDGKCATYEVPRRAYPVRVSESRPRLTRYRRTCVETRHRLLWRGVCLTWSQARKVGVPSVPVVQPAETIPGCHDPSIPTG